MAKTLLDSGAEVDARTEDHKAPIDFAVEGCHLDTVEVLGWNEAAPQPEMNPHPESEGSSRPFGFPLFDKVLSDGSSLKPSLKISIEEDLSRMPLKKCCSLSMSASIPDISTTSISDILTTSCPASCSQ